MVAGNLDKVVAHGKRANSIVKNMLLHSREGSGERTSVNVNAMVEESAQPRLSRRAGGEAGIQSDDRQVARSRSGLRRPLRAGDDPGPVEPDLQRVLRDGEAQAERAGPDLRAHDRRPTRDLGDRVAIAIRDNGTGIPDEVKAKMFNPFFTTKPAGEGTGLGLSLSYDIVVKQHGGTLEVSTEPGAFTEFTIILPRRSAT